MPINSVIGFPNNEQTVTLDADGTLGVRGYAVPQGDQGPVVRVEVSGDGGSEWVEAEFEGPSERFAWVLWRAKVKMERGEGKQMLSQATDHGGNVQPRTCEWNLRGVAYNGYGESSGLTVV